MRNFFATGLFWGDAAGRYLVLWVGLLGAMAATRDDNHISIDIISRYSSEKIKPLIRMITDSATAFICGLLTYSAVIFIRDEMSSGIDAFASVPTWIAGIILPAAFGIICVRYLVYLVKHTIEAVNVLNKNKEPG